MRKQTLVTMGMSMILAFSVLGCGDSTKEINLTEPETTTESTSEVEETGSVEEATQPEEDWASYTVSYTLSDKGYARLYYLGNNGKNNWFAVSDSEDNPIYSIVDESGNGNNTGYTSVSTLAVNGELFVQNEGDETYTLIDTAKLDENDKFAVNQTGILTYQIHLENNAFIVQTEEHYVLNVPDKYVLTNKSVPDYAIIGYSDGIAHFRKTDEEGNIYDAFYNCEEKDSEAKAFSRGDSVYVSMSGFSNGYAVEYSRNDNGSINREWWDLRDTNFDTLNLVSEKYGDLAVKGNETIGRDGWLLVAYEATAGADYLENGFFNVLTGQLTPIPEETVGYEYSSKNEDGRTYSFDNYVFLCESEDDDHTHTLYDLNSGEIKQTGLSYIEKEMNGHTLFQKGDEWGYLDSDGTILATYEDASNFNNGYALVIEDGKTYIINEELKKVAELGEWEGVSATSTEYRNSGTFFRVNKDGLYYLVSVTGINNDSSTLADTSSEEETGNTGEFSKLTYAGQTKSIWELPELLETDGWVENYEAPCNAGIPYANDLYQATFAVEDGEDIFRVELYSKQGSDFAIEGISPGMTSSEVKTVLGVPAAEKAGDKEGYMAYYGSGINTLYLNFYEDKVISVWLILEK